MKLLGLTGGIAMGKTTVGELLGREGVAVIDTDSLAREAVEPGQSTLSEIRRVFGSGMIDEAGRLKREEMARLVFEDEKARRRLEAILHPRIREHWLSEVSAWRSRNLAVGVVIIPLLFETSAEGHFDNTICVACTPESQRDRLAQRGWSLEECARRVQAQWPVEQKMAWADYVIWTEGDFDLTAEQVRRSLARLR